MCCRAINPINESASAFTTGSRHRSVIAVTDGLLRTLNDRELTAVMAHEISHLKNNDLRMMNVSATFSQITSMLSAIGMILLILNLPLILISDHHFSWFGILFLIMAPTLAMTLQLALSRTREFDADLGAAELTGDPRGLASALLKIENYQHRWLGMFRWSGPSRPYDALWNTHPATRDRVKRLMAVAQKSSLHRCTGAGMENFAFPARMVGRKGKAGFCSLDNRKGPSQEEVFSQRPTYAFPIGEWPLDNDIEPFRPDCIRGF
jgi:heat shock protein HtpX